MSETRMIYAAAWAQADVLAVATGIYMERYRIGWFAAREELNDEAAKNGTTADALADEIVRRLDQRKT